MELVLSLPQLYVLCLFTFSGVLCCKWVDAVVRLCWALQGDGPQAEQDRPAGATQCRQTLSPSGGACRLCRVLDPSRALSQLTWWEKKNYLDPSMCPCDRHNILWHSQIKIMIGVIASCCYPAHLTAHLPWDDDLWGGQTYCSCVSSMICSH